MHYWSFQTINFECLKNVYLQYMKSVHFICRVRKILLDYSNSNKFRMLKPFFDFQPALYIFQMKGSWKIYPTTREYSARKIYALSLSTLQNQFLLLYGLFWFTAPSTGTGCIYFPAKTFIYVGGDWWCLYYLRFTPLYPTKHVVLSHIQVLTCIDWVGWIYLE